MDELDTVTETEDGGSYTTAGGIRVRRTLARVPYDGATEPLVAALDERKGVLLSSNYEYAGRYKRWDLGFCDPPICLAARGLDFRLSAESERGRVLLPGLRAALAELDCLEHFEAGAEALTGRVQRAESRFPEELRSKQTSIFTVIRALMRRFAAAEDPYLGLYGAFGYDLAFQFEAMRRRRSDDPQRRDLVLFLPDRILVVDHHNGTATWHRYEFTVDGASTEELAGAGVRQPYVPADRVEAGCDHGPGAYAATVRRAKEAFRAGDLFEVVPSQCFYEASPAPSEVFRRLRERNPAPYGFLINLGEREYLVGASPEMYVRVEGKRLETCPISGTIKREGDPIGDARQILKLLQSAKDESELTMCTDVDRNDKSRICEPGTVRVIGRRQIEMYSRLIHTVDHVEGRLREGFDAIDAFLTHAWAVTVTGAPKKWAMQFIEDHERSPRNWYGGAVGLVGFNGDMNTGLTLRTIQIKDGVAAIRAGATLLFDSDPDEEEQETRIKAEAFLDAVRRPRGAQGARAAGAADPYREGAGRRVLLVDHEDSFVNTLADYFRQTGAEVVTWRSGFDRAEIAGLDPDLVVLSPGPGRPADFGVAETAGYCVAQDYPLFGVCLGLQGIVEHFGGRLGVLDYPMHGKPSRVRVKASRLFDGLPGEFVVGRYHSLYAEKAALPQELRLIAESDDGIVMGIEHARLPVAAVQFHPESILTLERDIGLTIIRNLMRGLPARAGVDRAPA